MLARNLLETAYSHRRAAYASTSSAGIQGPVCVGGGSFFSVRAHLRDFLDFLDTCLRRHARASAAVRCRHRRVSIGAARAAPAQRWRPAVIGAGGIQEDLSAGRQ